MKKIFFYMLLIISITTFFGFFIYYKRETTLSVGLINEYGDINAFGNIEFKITRILDSYRGLDIRINKAGLTDQETGYTAGYTNDFIDKGYREIARGEKLPFGSYELLENDDYQTISILRNENYTSEYTHKIIIKNKRNGEIIKNEIPFDDIDVDFYEIGAASIIQDRLYAIIRNIYYADELEKENINKYALRLFTYDLNTGEKVEEKLLINDLDTSDVYSISEEGNIYFSAIAVNDFGSMGDITVYKYSILHNKLEEILYSRDASSIIPSADSNKYEYFYYSSIRGIIEYDDKVYLIDGDNSIMCLDRDYKIMSVISLRDVLKEYGDIFSGWNKELIIYEDKVFFYCIESESARENDIKEVIAVISLKDNSVLYYGEIDTIGNDSYRDSLSSLPLNSGFHIK